MKALSVRSPWAQMIIYGIPLFKKVDTGRVDGSYMVERSGRVVIKDIENRGWKIPPRFSLPMRVYIQVGKKEVSIEEVLDICMKKIGFGPITILALTSPKLGRGVIIGEVDIVKCVTKSKSPWFTGPYGFVLRNPVAYKNPIPCKGKLGFFEPPPEVIEEIKRLNG